MGIVAGPRVTLAGMVATLAEQHDATRPVNTPPHSLILVAELPECDDIVGAYGRTDARARPARA